MNKIYVGILVGIFVLSLVSAAVISNFNISNVIFDAPQAKPVPNVEQITFDCGTIREVVINISEPDGKYDDNDLRSVINANCTEEVSNIQMNGIFYKQNKYGTRSFDETYLKADECPRDGNVWNKTLVECHEPQEELGDVE